MIPKTSSKYLEEGEVRISEEGKYLTKFRPYLRILLTAKTKIWDTLNQKSPAEPRGCSHSSLSSCCHRRTTEWRCPTACSGCVLSLRSPRIGRGRRPRRKSLLNGIFYERFTKNKIHTVMHEAPPPHPRGWEALGNTPWWEAILA